MEMPKMKTKSGAKKRFRVTASGRVKFKASHARHMQMNKPKSMKRKTKGSSILCDSDGTSVLEHWMPYAGPKKSKRSIARKKLAAAKEALKAKLAKKAPAKAATSKKAGE
jgi:large subunit ribosomal protein L35